MILDCLEHVVVLLDNKPVPDIELVVKIGTASNTSLAWFAQGRWRRYRLANDIYVVLWCGTQVVAGGGTEPTPSVAFKGVPISARMGRLSICAVVV